MARIRRFARLIAEIELDKAEQAITLPDWIGVELTHDYRFSNSALSLLERAPEAQ